MIKGLITFALVVSLVLANSRSEKAAPVLDQIQIDLQKGKSTELTHKIDQHNDQAFMASIDLDSASSPPPEFQILMTNKDKQIAKCHFKYLTNICVLERNTQQVKIKVDCLSESCKFKLNLSQRVLYHFEGSQQHKSKALTLPGEIYKMDKQKFNSILEIYSELKEQILLPNQIKVLSNVHAFRLTQVEELDSSSAIFGLKPVITSNDQYFFIEDAYVKNRQLRLNLKTHGGFIKQGVPVVDFLQTYGHRSLNSYNYDGTFTHHIQIYARVFNPRNESNLPFSIIVQGKNQHSSNSTTISAVHMDSIPFEGHKFFDIAFTITKARHSGFKIISFDLVIDKLQNKTVFVEFQVLDSVTSDVHIFDYIYFSSEKDEELSFAVNQQIKYDILGADKDVSIITNASEKYLTNTATCSLHKGCDVTVKTTGRCQACSFRMDLKGTDIMNHLVYYQVKDNVIDAKIDFDEQLYFKKTMEPNKIYQIVTNTPNVMIYANFEGYKRCRVPSASCHQFAINQQTPQLLSNKETKEQALIIEIVGLEMTLFKVRFIENVKGLEVSLGEKFSYLFDDEEKEITLKFITDRETFTERDTHINFNLISPTNSLQLTVTNQDGMTYTAIDGYIQFQKKDIIGDKFTIEIKKIGMFFDQYVHMTLIITTSDTAIRLDSTSTHYEKYLPNQQKKFLVEFDSSEESSLNIYTQNLQKYKGQMHVTIFDLNLDQVDEQKKPIIQKYLLRDNEIIDLDLQLQALDLCQEVNCELQITIKSIVSHEVEQMITVLHEESVIMLDDSIWSSFQINDLSKSNHFYFIPRQEGKPINILFNTEDKDLFIDYSIYHTKRSINPQDWPWDRHTDSTKDEIVKHLNGHQQFTIPADSPDIKKCWPNCVVLMTVGDANRKIKNLEDKEIVKSYKILVSSTIVEMSEDTRFQITMESDEQNTMFIQLANFINSKAEEFTFFTEYKIGRAVVTATLVSKGQEYKLGDSNKDFIFEDIETHLPMATISTVIQSFKLNPEETSLQINFKALSTVKLYFQFTSYMKHFNRLQMDDLQIVRLRQGEQIWYQYIPERDYSIKFYRARGFPLFKIIECDEESFVDCLSKHKKLLDLQVSQKKRIEERLKVKNNTVNSDIQIDQQLQTSTAKELQLFIDKNYEYSKELCQKCIVFIWVYCYAQDLEMSINIRSSSSETQLREMVVVNDRIEKKEYHYKYLLNVEPDKLAMITFRIIEGLCRVEVEDSTAVLFNQTFSSLDKDYKDIGIDPLSLPEPSVNRDEEESNQDDIPNIPPVFKSVSKSKQKHNVIRHLHLKITSISDLPIQYLVSYSLGNSGVYLEDGIVAQKKMKPDVSHVFYYHNIDKTSHAYLTLSSTPEDGYSKQYSRNEYEVRFFYYPDANRRDIREEFKPEMPPKKNENYLGQTISHVYELPIKFELFEIELFTKNYLQITASINHKELIFLPIGFQYLIKLRKQESIYFVIERPTSDYLEMSVKKCDTSIPTLYYTNDAREFKEGLYETQEEIENGYEKKLIKTKKSSKTIHVKFTAEEDMGSLFTVSVSPSTDLKKSQSHKVKTGNNGIISYSFLDTSKVDIQFSPVTCDGQTCSVLPQYYLMVGSSLDSIYGELNCAGTYMVSGPEKTQESQIFEVTQKHFDNHFNVFRMTVELKQKQAFIGVKAIAQSADNKRVEVMYAPTQIENLWGQAEKLSVGIFLVFSVALAIIITIVIIVSTKIARRGYRPISSDE